jgi:hypothetical protein
MRVAVVAFGSNSRHLPAGGEAGRVEMQVEEGRSVREPADIPDLPAEVRGYVMRVEQHPTEAKNAGGRPL